MQGYSGLQAALALVRDNLAQVEQLLQHVVAPVAPDMQAMLRHVLHGGKRIRPLLVLLVGRLFEPFEAPSFCRLAAAVELLHTATLIHDDIVDAAPRRRAVATLHTMHSVGDAVLAGDCLLALSVDQVARLENPAVVRVLAGALAAMSQGELEQVRRPEGAATIEAYYRSIDSKSASLCAAAAEMAALLAHADAVQVSAARSFGQDVGLGFQIMDDILDITGDERQLGKLPGGDLSRGLLTLPVLYHLESARHDDPVRLVLSGFRQPSQVAAAVSALRQSSAIPRALETARAHSRAARQALACLPNSEARHALGAIADYVVARDS